MNNEYLFCGRWYRPDYIDAHRSSIDLPPSQTLPTDRGRGSDTENEGEKGEEREERRRRPIRQSWRIQRAGGERRGGKERTIVSS